ncbi:MAG: carbohydrate-binding domain-containing protein [Prevotella sp.]|nr:carbohydrate-binding domain-containing protein [Prevotella sp.]
MKKLLSIMALALAINASAIDNNTVEIVYNGSSASVTVASNISSYVTVSSGTSSHVKIVQSATFAGVDATSDNEDGEIIYVLSGSSTDGEFYMEGSFKATVELKGLTLTNPSGPAINIQDGKRIAVSAKNGTVNTLSDGANETYNGCFHSKGHTKLKGKGTLNVAGNSKHAIYSKEYIEVKNLTLNITAAQKDAIHCKEYFLMESGNVTITGATDDGIQVELDGTSSTGATTDHEDEDTGNFYMTGGTLSISGYGGKAIKTDGSINYSGGTQNFDTSDTSAATSIEGISSEESTAGTEVYDLQGRRTTITKPGLYIFKNGNTTTKRIIR